jgi:tRNA(Ile)-lysidine synthase TilS/MesJ
MGHNLRKVSQFIEKQQLLSPGEKVLVGVSGGSDSVALLLCCVV